MVPQWVTVNKNDNLTFEWYHNTYVVFVEQGSCTDANIVRRDDDIIAR